MHSICYPIGFLSNSSICFHIVQHIFSPSTLLAKVFDTRG
nr:MAG TPA: hypothetical protein [Caudoviricetes sp.]